MHCKDVQLAPIFPRCAIPKIDPPKYGSKISYICGKLPFMGSQIYFRNAHNSGVCKVLITRNLRLGVLGLLFVSYHCIDRHYFILQV